MHRDRHEIPTFDWSARLELAYALRDGRTVPVHRRHVGPLRVQKHFHPEPSGACHQIVVHPPGGVAGGDALSLEVSLEAGAHALITSPGAAKWYDGHERQAFQELDVRVAPGATLEWLPQETILFDGAEVNLCSRFRLSGDARLLAADVVCLGRPASGEVFAGGGWKQHTCIERDGRLLYVEPLSLAGGGALLASRVGLGGKSVMATLLWAGPPVPPELHRACREVGGPGLLAAVSQLPEVWVARCLADSAEAAHAYCRTLWRMLRPALVGHAAHPPRIWNT